MEGGIQLDQGTRGAKRERASRSLGKGSIKNSVSQPPGRGPVLDPGINYTGPREVNIL
jgi:hypothetical protein